ncbi:MAG: NrdH-redoxin [Candidatus Spechtbacteria bacterium RIFCSPLOWO2_01_FULL_46_10]|uniref:NrdH-redoxin n=1 Tax=Candidatus Spechtbacteria bacterium RIFCSPLOWO2_01_FULL_46_10 TaxID=1802163 RepID=A0A1G2HHT6_9BACT|nr:MAG: NrdH-redoxin [Candidatus Spechtbacteria bacterium RIFCSPLOWO2_01_FULL_46_10]
MPTVTIYTTPTCHFCHMAKEFFKEHNVEYTEKDVSQDLSARNEMVEKTCQLGVPVIVIGDQVVVGFDKGAVSDILELKD